MSQEFCPGGTPPPGQTGRHHPPDRQAGKHSPGQTPLLGRHPPPRQPSDGHCSRRHTTYWNAFLLVYVSYYHYRHLLNVFFLPSANEVCEGCFYTCLSFCPEGGLGPGPGGGWGVWLGQVSRPRPRGRLGGLAGGCSGPEGCIPACTETPPQQTATAADGTHPTGMHSCYCHKNNRKKMALSPILFAIHIITIDTMLNFNSDNNGHGLKTLHVNRS